ncbi:hypothetical protein LXL04_023357 [Taraxacum kok-saghyz]
MSACGLRGADKRGGNSLRVQDVYGDGDGGGSNCSPDDGDGDDDDDGGVWSHCGQGGQVKGGSVSEIGDSDGLAEIEEIGGCGSGVGDGGGDNGGCVGDGDGDGIGEGDGASTGGDGDEGGGNDGGGDGAGVAGGGDTGGATGTAGGGGSSGDCRHPNALQLRKFTFEFVKPYIEIFEIRKFKNKIREFSCEPRWINDSTIDSSIFHKITPVMVAATIDREVMVVGDIDNNEKDCMEETVRRKPKAATMAEP